MNFEDQFKDGIEQVKDKIPEIVKFIFNEEKKEFETDLKEYFDNSKDLLKKWTKLLAEKQIDKDEYELLIESQKDLMVLILLKHKGYSRIRLTALATKVFDIVIEIFFKILAVALV